jgi:CRISPR/Cas system-associated exonuclease Cas4 (RecB family)
MLKSRPHAFIEEGKLLLPLDIHPSTDKIRDRHVVQLLVHLKILSEKLAAALPHGYLLMGPKSRLVKIAFDEEKQSWIESMYKQAGAILDSNSAEALPEKYKCRGCDVREFCQFRADRIGS